MKVGLPKEIKNNENRVGMTPAGVKALVSAGHEVLVEKTAGLGSGILDAEYIDAGATMVDTAAEAWGAEMVVKVKEPLESEYKFFREGQILYTYLHLAAEVPLIHALLEKKVEAVAYETIQLADGSLPLLAPMSEVAGRRATIVGATYLEKHRGGSGVLLSGVPGTERGHVVVVGAGVSGISAAKMAVGLGANVTILDVNIPRLRYIDDTYKEMQTLYSSEHNVYTAVKSADVVISTVLIPGAKAPKIIKEYMVKEMRPGSVIVDVAIDQGGSVETIDRITTHDQPVYEKHGVLHYSVANMPGATPRTSTYALTNATLPYMMMLANGGIKAALKNEALLKGVNAINGHITYPAVAEAVAAECHSAKDIIEKM